MSLDPMNYLPGATWDDRQDRGAVS